MASENHQEAFLMEIDLMIAIKGRGVCILGPIQYGTLKMGDTVQVSGMDKPSLVTTVTGFGGFPHHEPTFVLSAERNLGIVLKGVTLDQLEKGMVVTKFSSTSGE